MEATINEFVKPLNHKGKLCVWGKFKIVICTRNMGLSVNFKRIHRYMTVNPELSKLLGLMKDGIPVFNKFVLSG